MCPTPGYPCTLAHCMCVSCEHMEGAWRLGVCVPLQIGLHARLHGAAPRSPKLGLGTHSNPGSHPTQGCSDILWNGSHEGSPAWELFFFPVSSFSCFVLGGKAPSQAAVTSKPQRESSHHTEKGSEGSSAATESSAANTGCSSPGVWQLVLRINAIYEVRRGKKRVKRLSQSMESNSGKVTDENSESDSDTEEKLKAHSQRLVNVKSRLKQAPRYPSLARELIEYQERQLFEYFVVVSLHKKQAGAAYVPELTQQFPLKILDEVEKRRGISPALVQPLMRSVMEAPFPALGKTILVKNFLPGSGTEVIELCRPLDSRLEHVDFESLFSSLSVRHLVCVFASCFWRGGSSSLQTSSAPCPSAATQWWR
ncbi:hypothetical protein H8959_007872 [Pygathrix nigripes]